MRNQLRGFLAVVSVVLMFGLTAPTVPAQKRHPRLTNAAARHSEAAAKVSTEIMNVPEKAIPRNLLDKADTIAVFPGVLKTAFVFGGRGGQGVAAVPIFPSTLTRYSKRESHLLSPKSNRPLNSLSVVEPPMLRSQASPPTRQTIGSSSSAKIAREVRHELLLLPYYNVFDWLEFQVEPNGTVILRGQVVSPPDTKSNAEAAVKGVAGVKKVVNQIEVLPLSPNDDRLRRQLYRAIFDFDSPLFRYALQPVPSIHIIVKNGNATLKGEVDTDGDKQLAYMQALKVSGVFEVKNELQVMQNKPQ